MSDLRTAALRALEAMEKATYMLAFLSKQDDKYTEAWEELCLVGLIPLRAALADAKVDSQAIAKQPSPPPEAQTEAEQIAYCAGWWDALAKGKRNT